MLLAIGGGPSGPRGMRDDTVPPSVASAVSDVLVEGCIRVAATAPASVRAQSIESAAQRVVQSMLTAAQPVRVRSQRDSRHATQLSRCVLYVSSRGTIPPVHYRVHTQNDCGVWLQGRGRGPAAC